MCKFAEVQTTLGGQLTSEGKYAGEPLVLKQCWERIERRYKALIHPSDHRSNRRSPLLEEHHGAQLIKCNRLACSFSRTGFSTKIGSNSHAQSHIRSFKCRFETCKFATIGFFSEGQLNQYTKLFHTTDNVRRPDGGSPINLA